MKRSTKHHDYVKAHTERSRCALFEYFKQYTIPNTWFKTNSYNTAQMIEELTDVADFIYYCNVHDKDVVITAYMTDFSLLKKVASRIHTYNIESRAMIKALQTNRYMKAIEIIRLHTDNKTTDSKECIKATIRLKDAMDKLNRLKM